MIGVLSELPLILFDKMEIGKTNAARANNITNMTTPKILTDVLKLEKTAKLLSHTCKITAHLDHRIYRIHRSECAVPHLASDVFHLSMSRASIPT